MSEKVNLPLASNANYERHCKAGSCGNHYRDDSGKTYCNAMENKAYGQLQQLVGDGEPCPKGIFGEKPEPPSDESGSHVFLSLLEAAKEVVFKFDDGELTWKKG